MRRNLDNYAAKVQALSEQEATLRNLYLKKIAMGEVLGPVTNYAALDKPWMKQYSDEVISAKLPEMTAYEYLYHSNKNNLEAIALNYFDTLITYGELFEKTEKYAKCFAALGVQKGDVVSICMPTTVEVVEAFYALNRLGAIPDMLDPRSNKNQLKFYMQENGSKIALIVDLCYEKIESIISETSLEKVIVLSIAESMPFVTKTAYQLTRKKMKEKPAYGEVYLSWKEFASLNGDGFGDVSYCKDTPALVVHSSGTSGRPKGMLLSNDNLNSVAFQFKLTPIRKAAGERFLSAIPAFAAFGMIASIHMPLCLNLYTVIQPAVTSKNIVKLVLKYKPNHSLTVPQNYDVLTADKRIKDLSYFITLGCGGDAVNLNVERRIEEDLRQKNSTGHLHKGWGMSELGSAACLELPDCRQLGSVGVPFSHNLISVFEPDTDQELPYNTQGEICVSGPSVMLEYMNNKELTDKVIKRHGDGRIWLHSGDIGRVTEEGMIFIDSRMERMIIRFDGFKIFPPAIEDVITELTDIESCAVIGIKDKEAGKVPKAFLVVAPDCNKDPKTLEKEVLAHCQEKLAERAVPYYFEFIEALPMTLMGKVDYRALEK